MRKIEYRLRLENMLFGICARLLDSEENILFTFSRDYSIVEKGDNRITFTWQDIVFYADLHHHDPEVSDAYDHRGRPLWHSCSVYLISPEQVGYEKDVFLALQNLRN